MKKLTKVLSAVLCCALALVLVASPALLSYASTPNVEVTRITPCMATAEPISLQAAENNYDFSGVTGWSAPTYNGGMGMELVGEDGVGIPLPSIYEFVDANSRTRLENNPIEAIIAEVFGYSELTLEDVAYLEYADFDTIPFVQELILMARYELVFSDDVSWTVDGQMEIVNADGSIVTLPEFDELFPGWNLSQIDAVRSDALAIQGFADAIMNVENIAPLFTFFDRNVNLPVQSNVNAPVFHTFINDMGFTVSFLARVEAVLNGGPTVNIGANNMSLPGQPSVGWAGNLMAGQGVRILNIPNLAQVGLRGSMTQQSGVARISVGLG